jgi:hypothetical protein
MADEFTRRSVNLGLIAAAIGLAASGRAPAARPPTPLFDFAIAGGFYHGLRSVRGSLIIGERLALAPEPDNPHDGNAVAVMREGLRLGYIPRAANAPVAALLKDGRTIRCEIANRLTGWDDIEAFAWTGYTSGDPLLRLTLEG